MFGRQPHLRWKQKKSLRPSCPRMLPPSTFFRPAMLMGSENPLAIWWRPSEWGSDKFKFCVDCTSSLHGVFTDESTAGWWLLWPSERLIEWAARECDQSNANGGEKPFSYSQQYEDEFILSRNGSLTECTVPSRIWLKWSTLSIKMQRWKNPCTLTSNLSTRCISLKVSRSCQHFICCVAIKS